MSVGVRTAHATVALGMDYFPAAAWILAGGAHHTCFSQNLTIEHMEDFSEMADVELVVIDENTRLRRFKQDLRWNETYYK